MSQVDTDEIHHFDALADDWWNPRGKNRALHWIQPPRLRFIRDHINPEGVIWLDVGCGAGLLSEALAKQGARVSGIDLSGAMIDAARAHAQTEHLTIDYAHISLEDWLATEQTVGALSCLELLEHVPNPEKMVADCARALEQGGQAFFSTISRTPKAFLSTILAAEYALGWVEKGTHHYAQFIRPSELIRWCTQAGLDVIDIKGLCYVPWRHAFEISDDCSANYILCARKS